MCSGSESPPSLWFITSGVPEYGRSGLVWIYAEIMNPAAMYATGACMQGCASAAYTISTNFVGAAARTH